MYLLKSAIWGWKLLENKVQCEVVQNKSTNCAKADSDRLYQDHHKIYQYSDSCKTVTVCAKKDEFQYQNSYHYGNTGKSVYFSFISK
jgi:hypothetical protein